MVRRGWGGTRRGDAAEMALNSTERLVIKLAKALAFGKGAAFHLLQKSGVKLSVLFLTDASK